MFITCLKKKFFRWFIRLVYFLYVQGEILSLHAFFEHLSYRRCILAFDGDSTDVDAWSNIPHLISAELQKRDITLIRVNLQQPLWIKLLWRYTLGLRHKLRHHTSTDFYRSFTNHLLTTWRLNRVSKRIVERWLPD